MQPAAHAGVICCIKLQNAAQSPDRVMLVLEGASKSYGNAGQGMQLVPRDLAPSGDEEGGGAFCSPHQSLSSIPRPASRSAGFKDTTLFIVHSLIGNGDQFLRGISCALRDRRDWALQTG